MENQYHIIYTENMQNDLDKIEEYRYSINLEKQLTKIDEDIERLKWMPRVNKTIIFAKDPKGEYRRMLSGKYVIIYKIQNQAIIILRIFNQKQNYLNPELFILKEESTTYQIKNKKNSIQNER